MKHVKHGVIDHYLKSNPAAPAKQVIKATGCSSSAVHLARKRLCIPSLASERNAKYANFAEVQAEVQVKEAVKQEPMWSELAIRRMVEQLEEDCSVINLLKNQVMKLKGVVEFLEEKLDDEGIGFNSHNYGTSI
jgi:hypothetical protein